MEWESGARKDDQVCGSVCECAHGCLDVDGKNTMLAESATHQLLIHFVLLVL